MKFHFFRPKHELMLFTILLILPLVGCTTLFEPGADFPDVGVPFAEMNRDLQLSAPEAWNNYKINEAVGLNVEVISEYPIQFPNDYGVRIYRLDQKNWVEVENFVNYLEGDILLYPTEGDPFRAGQSTTYPLLGEQDRPVRIRIILVGNIIRDGVVTEEKTGGYIDLTLKP